MITYYVPGPFLSIVTAINSLTLCTPLFLKCNLSLPFVDEENRGDVTCLRSQDAELRYEPNSLDVAHSFNRFYSF